MLDKNIYYPTNINLCFIKNYSLFNENIKNVIINNIKIDLEIKYILNNIINNIINE